MRLEAAMKQVSAALVLALAAGRVAGDTQSPPPAEAVRTVEAWAADEKGRPVDGLSASEVVILEGGTARVVTKLEKDARPLSVAIVVDSSAPLATNYRLNVVDAVAGFVRALPPGARFTIWSTGDRPRQVLELTEDRARAATALRRVFPSGGNTLLDALVEAADQLGQREAERTALVVVTGVGIGFANMSRQQVVERVRQSGALVMAVQFEERGSAEFQAQDEQVPRADVDYVLSTLTRETGGLYERPISGMGVASALDKVAPALSGRYRLSYLSDSAKPGKLELQVARPGVTARVVGGSR